MNLIKAVGKIALLHGFVPGPGLEPGWVAPAVFETAASTDSAIRAFVSAKISILSHSHKNIFHRARFFAVGLGGIFFFRLVSGLISGCEARP